MSLEISSNEIVPIGAGTKFDCYYSAGKVYKISTEPSDDKNNEINKLEDNLSLISSYLGEYVVPSNIYSIQSGSEKRIIIEQKYIHGVTLGNAIDSGRNVDKIKEFLSETLEMYRCTGLMPDVAGRPHFIGWYHIESTPNVVVDENMKPHLVDIGLSRLSTHPTSRYIHNKLLANGVQELLSRIWS